MAEPFKNLFNLTLIENLSNEIIKVDPSFDSHGFKVSVFDEDWDNRELKDRMHHISVCLRKYLPEDYIKAVDILLKVSSNSSGFQFMFFPDFVEMYGLDYFEKSVEALEFFTTSSSSEFAVRPFIIKYPGKMMKQMMIWSKSENHHIRRLSSEGCRPRLPWAMALHEFKKDPTTVIKLLEKLKNDESEYVRRSVANNLNDISKDHPDLILKLAKKWKGQSPETDQLIKHACRTMLKNGVTEVLELFGFGNPEKIKLLDFNVDQNVKMGDKIQFGFSISSEEGQLGRLRIEYAIDFMKSNGKQSAKVFKISEGNYQDSVKKITRKYSFKKITTRKYYSGLHGISIIINGKEFIRGEFILLD
ncbi:MAG: DNA alkylation repair protein [Candidatus Marinimicrobia bacterium]|jgi:3-methyladenine DNA glycosylase AlkC|nr:DNA alkylation repair protein [Candidatus Neomarinimicrobiota bacterium]MBT3681901.1 DNA alkylation repair protein [Candidatus Neomarinimicrobiota bacterium]MBT3759070.1 DNA alkylation repair protein [Candidatus Neomarinimicrobiota bacterium]MBT3895031.1 DNA alkylation repair protein [Candidatus Neomarinimicrobiota bacterium]MBT4172077.1 DNA alkylation repair protein [Candidatus Neomarinimicrobiota bacterium]